MESIEKNIAAATSGQKLSESKEQAGSLTPTGKEPVTSPIQTSAGDAENGELALNSLESGGTVSAASSLKDVTLITARSIELQNALERQSKELAEARLRLADMQTR